MAQKITLELDLAEGKRRGLFVESKRRAFDALRAAMREAFPDDADDYFGG